MSEPVRFPSDDPLTGAVVREVRQPAPHELVLRTFRADLGELDWLLSIDPACARFLRTFRRARNAPRPPIFCLWLRARLVGARLETPRLLGPRALAIPAVHGDGARFMLVWEANGPESDLLLLDGEQRLLIALRHPAPPGRSLAPGEPYAPPRKRRPLPPDCPPDAWRFGADLPRAQALDRAAREREASAGLEALRREALRAAKAGIKRLRRRIAHQRADLARAEGAEQMRRWGELLKIHRERLRPGLAEIAVPDEFDPARPEVTIPLDARAGPAGNIERLFQRYRKLRAALPHIRRRLEEAEATLARRVAAAEEIGRAQNRPELEARFERLGSPLPESAPLVPRRRETERGESDVLRRTSSDGFTILVGRSKDANDRVTFRIGNGRDWWFHAQGIPGAHVLVRNPGGGALPERTLREAAWLAAYYSQRRQEGKLDVDYTQRKHVRKIKGGEPGQVTYSQNRTLLADLADERAAAILAEGADREG